MKNHLKLSLCLVIICVLCVLPIPVFATEIDIFSTFDAGKQSGFEPYIMPISELVPTAEGTPQPNTINMQSELVLTASVNNTSENEPGDLISTEFIYTTDGTVVEAYHWYDYPENAKESKQYDIVNGDADPNGIAYTELVGDNVIDLPTWTYNCHAFAWYNNTVWINSAQPFINDNHTEQISVEDLQEGDIVTYWEAINSNNEIAEYSSCLHSAIVERIEPDGTIVCRSKWGDWGLYIHDINYVPTSYCNTVMNEEDGILQGHEIACLFYRYTHNEHNLIVDVYPNYHDVMCANCSYSYGGAHVYSYSSLSDSRHTATCVECGYEYSEAHSFSRIKTGNLSVHKVQCSSCSYSYTEAHTWSNAIGGYLCAVCGEISDAIPDIMSLPDPELEAYLASLSDEEREEFIASLPEDQVERVTALLPSDDEHLTE